MRRDGQGVQLSHDGENQTRRRPSSAQDGLRRPGGRSRVLTASVAATIPVFVSSTWLDLQPERTRIEWVLNRFRETKFQGMEYFGSRPEGAQQVSLDELARCVVYIGVVGGRYGSGITEMEYHEARSRKLPCFVYLKR